MSNKKIEIVGNRIKELREQNKFSQKDLAQAGKCTKQHISQIEKSDSVCISEEALFNLSTLLQCSPDYLRGIVDEPDMIRTGYKVSADESNAMSNKSCDTQKEYKTIRYASDPGNFRDLLIRKISTMPSNKWLILNMLLDCLKQCNDNEVKRFEEVCKIFFSYRPQYENSILQCPDYIYTKIRDEVLPNIELDAYNYVFTIYREKIASCSLEDSEFKAALDQNLGDFQKECKQKFRLKIQSAVIPNKRSDDSSSSITINNISEIVEHILMCILSSIEREINSNDFKKCLPNNIHSLQERRSIMEGLRKHMVLRVKSYTKNFVDDISNFFKK